MIYEGENDRIFHSDLGGRLPVGSVGSFGSGIMAGCETWGRLGEMGGKIKRKCLISRVPSLLTHTQGKTLVDLIFFW